MINPEFKAKWIAALRSGEYTQGIANLYTDESDSFCCLGVAGLIAGVPKERMNRKTNPTLDLVYTEVCPGLEDVDRAELIQMNDGTDKYWNEKKTFEEIADHIEKYL